MTETDPPSTAASPRPNTTDPRPRFDTAIATVMDLVETVTPADLERPTPCDEYDVRALLGHMLTVLRRPAALATGADAMAFPDFVSGVADDAWGATFAADRDTVLTAWADDAVLDREMALPWVQGPGRRMLPTYTSELTVHTWDLARALDATPAWDDEVVAEALAVSALMLPDGERETMVLPNGMAIPFASAVEVAADAAPIDRLVGWYGRTPA
ncbi:MAG: TIGR03086 family metal-binding protein [Acidimicrobiales bacterium]